MKEKSLRKKKKKKKLTSDRHVNCLCPQAPGRKETRAPLACLPAPLGPGIRRDAVFSGFSLLQGLVQGSPLKRRVLSVPRSTVLGLQAPAAPFLRPSEGLALCTHCGNLRFPLGHKVPGRAQNTTRFKCFFPDSPPPRVQDQAPENPSFLACSLGTAVSSASKFCPSSAHPTSPSSSQLRHRFFRKA